MQATLGIMEGYPTLQQRVDTVKVLLAEGADVNVQNEVRQW